MQIAALYKLTVIEEGEQHLVKLHREMPRSYTSSRC